MKIQAQSQTIMNEDARSSNPTIKKIDEEEA